MMPRYYIDNLGGAGKVDNLVGLAPSNYGTTLDGITKLGQLLGLPARSTRHWAPACAACSSKSMGSAFLTA